VNEPKIVNHFRHPAGRGGEACSPGGRPGLSAGVPMSLAEAGVPVRKVRGVHVMDERCFGCGRCIASCPEDAIRLEFQAGRGVPIPGV
jgi:ferredoxin